MTGNKIKNRKNSKNNNSGELPFMAVALGGDMNCYGVARTFYEAYGIKTVMIGRAPVFPTAHSGLVERYYDADLLEDEPLLRMLTEIDEKYPDKKKFLFATNDDYVRHVIHNKSRIEAIGKTSGAVKIAGGSAGRPACSTAGYIVPTIDEELFDRLDDKDSFYELCERYGLPYPKSVVFDCASDSVDGFELPFDYPIFIKPASNVIYFNFEFEGKQKGYKIESEVELRDVMGRIQGAGYPGRFVFQEYIEGDDDSMYIFSAYCDRSGRVRMTSGGRILMHDRTPELIGNYNAITDARDDRLTDRLRDFLESIEFTGICHFDVQYDAKRGDYVVYEINIRQGRSNYYMTASGMNYAKLLVNEYFGSTAAANPDYGYAVASRPFIVSNVSRRNLIRAAGRERVCRVPAKYFYRFQLAPYDRSLKNRITMRSLERSIMRSFREYNS